MAKKTEATAFDKAMGALVQVPKKELDAMERRYRAARAKRKKKKRK